MAVGFGNDRSHLEGASGAFSYMAYGQVQPQDNFLKKPEENIHAANERPVDLSGVSVFA